MDYTITVTPEWREQMKKWLEEHPIDHKYDDQVDLLAGKIPPEQLLSRDYQKILDETPED